MARSAALFASYQLPITLKSNTKDEPGSWVGIIFNNAKQSILNYVNIHDAKTGVTITNSAPTIKYTTVTRSSQAGLYLKDNSKPNISCSTFKFNEGQGGIVIEGEGVYPIIHNNSFVDNIPFNIQNYSPLEIDLSNNYWGDSKDLFMGNIILEPILESPPTDCDTISFLPNFGVR